MIKKIGIFLVFMFVVSCTASKSVIQTTKNGSFTPYTPDSKKQMVLKVTDTVKVDTTKTVILAATTRVKVTQEMVLAYIEKYKTISKNNMTQFGIPSSIILAQGILESGAGTGPLSSIANNHFGIKCHKEWNGPSVKYDDDSAQECFRKYQQPDESYKDHSLFLTSRPRYAQLFKLQKDDYRGWATGLRAAGYATDSLYATKLIGIIERYQLGKYDADVLGKEYISTTAIIVNEINKSTPTKPKDQVQITNITNNEAIIPKAGSITNTVSSNENPKQEGKSISIVEKKLSSDTKNQTKSISVVEKKLSSSTINDTKPLVKTIEIKDAAATNVNDNDVSMEVVKEKTIVVKNEIVHTQVPQGSYQVMKGDTLYSISRKFNLTVEDLKKKNNISDFNISIGQYLIVQ